MPDRNLPAKRNDLPARRGQHDLDRQDEVVVDSDHVRETGETVVTVHEVDYQRCPYCGEKMPLGAWVMCWQCGRGLWGSWYADGGVINGVGYDVKGLEIEGVTLPVHAAGSQNCSLVVVVDKTAHGEFIGIGGERRFPAQRYR